MYVVSDSSGSSTIISIGNVDEETGNVFFAINYDFDTVYVNSGKLLGVTKYTVQQLVTH